MTDILSEVTDSQAEAITHSSGPLIIVAGPGTGKTYTLVRRAAYLIDEQGVPPEKIFLSTFTNEATDELLTRIAKLVGKDAFKMQVSTIHSFCGDLLREYYDHHDWGANFRILDDQEQFIFLYNHYRELGLEEYKSRRYGLSAFLDDVIRFFNLCTEEQVDTNQLYRRIEKKGHDLLDLKKEKPESLREYKHVTDAYERYVDLLREEKILDFSHLQSVLYNIIKENPSVKEEISSSFDYYLIDEYQDTNRIQVEIIRELSEPEYNVTAVGDDDQSIYRFRGATVSSFLQFEDDFPGADRITLKKNFRSYDPIIQASTSLIHENAPDRVEKSQEPNRKNTNATKPIVFKTDTCVTESRQVVEYIESLREQEYIDSYDDVALLFRSVTYHSEFYLDQLEQRGIDYEVSGEGGFFDREDIVSLKDLFKFCSWKDKAEVDPLDGKLLELSPETIKVLESVSEHPDNWTEDEVLREMGISKETDRSIVKGIAQLRKQWSRDEFTDLLEVFYDILDASGYFEECCPREDKFEQRKEHESALLNLGQFSNLLDKFLYHKPTDNEYRFRSFLQTLPDDDLDDLSPTVKEDAVQVMTVHQAKGLEFPVVIIGSAIDNRFPRRYKRPKHPIPADLRMSGDQIDEETHYQDERRLFYVAMTRAEDLLIIGAPQKKLSRGPGHSRFVEEIDQDLLNENPQSNPLITSNREVDPYAYLPDRLSYSSLQKYLLCPLWYKLMYECEFATGGTFLRDQLEFGKALHRCMEELHTENVESQEEALFRAHEILEDVWEPALFLSEDQQKSLRGQARSALKNYVQHHYDRLSRVVAVENDIDYLTDQGVLIKGRTDLICRGEDGLEIIDFKVRTREGVDVLKPQKQVETYALAVEEETDECVSELKLHLLLEDPGEEVITIPWTDEKRSRARERISNALDGITRQEFTPTPGEQCSYCDFQRVCPDAQVEGEKVPDSPDLTERIDAELSSEATKT